MLGRKYRVGSGQTAVEHELGRMVKILEVKWHRKYARVKLGEADFPSDVEAQADKQDQNSYLLARLA